VAAPALALSAATAAIVAEAMSAPAVQARRRSRARAAAVAQRATRAGADVLARRACCRRQAAQEFVQLAEGEPFIVQLGWGALCACVPAPLRCRKCRFLYALPTQCLTPRPRRDADPSPSRWRWWCGAAAGCVAAPCAPVASALADATPPLVSFSQL